MKMAIFSDFVFFSRRKSERARMAKNHDQVGSFMKMAIFSDFMFFSRRKSERARMAKRGEKVHFRTVNI